MNIRFPLLFLLGSLSLLASAQPVDGIIGKKRSRVQQMLREYRILDYQKTKVEYAIDKNTRQTVIYVNDTCTAFFWAVNADRASDFMEKLQAHGFVFLPDSSLERNDVLVHPQRLESGRTVLFSASLKQTVEHEAVFPRSAEAQKGAGKNGKQDVQRVRGPIVLPLPLMQQAAHIEDADTTIKVKDPTRLWIGGAETQVRLLGY